MQQRFPSDDGPLAGEALTFSNLEDWRLWQQAQQPWLRRQWRQMKERRSVQQPLGCSLARWNAGGSRSILVAIDGDRTSLNAAVIAPLEELITKGAEVIVLGRPDWLPRVPGREDVAPSPDLIQSLRQVAAVLSAGDHMPNGRVAAEVALAAECPHFIVQHGILTPFAPPPPSGAHLLTWSDQDLTFWRSGRRDVSGESTGSQLLWEAQQGTGLRRQGRGSQEGVTFLGQLHGAELGRRFTRQTIASLLSTIDVEYRAHPGERDLLSRAQHELWRSQGIRVVTDQGLSGINQPTLAHFSTGLLEAAASGIPSYGYCARPPVWLLSLWERYEIAAWKNGSESPTSIQPILEPPAQMIAERLLAHL